MSTIISLTENVFRIFQGSSASFRIRHEPKLGSEDKRDREGLGIVTSKFLEYKAVQ